LHFDGVIASLFALSKTKVTVFAIVLAEWQTGFRVYHRQAHVSFAFDQQVEWLDRSRRTNLRAEVAVLMAAGVFRMRDWSPEGFESKLKAGRMQDRSRTDFEALTAPNA
jgi:hypothetical protein